MAAHFDLMQEPVLKSNCVQRLPAQMSNCVQRLPAPMSNCVQRLPALSLQACGLWDATGWGGRRVGVEGGGGALEGANLGLEGLWGVGPQPLKKRPVL